MQQRSRGADIQKFFLDTPYEYNYQYKRITDMIQKIDILAEKDSALPLLRNIDYRIARSSQELEKAYALVYRQYLKRNYVSVPGHSWRVPQHAAIEKSATFIWMRGEEVLATATVIPDSSLGLPMDAMYCEELGKFRAENKKICEISMLASNTDFLGENASLRVSASKIFFIFSLFKCLYAYTKSAGFDYICIAVHPKHRVMYDRFMFKDMGEIKSYEHANHAPAVAKYFNIQTAEKESVHYQETRLCRMFFARNGRFDTFVKKHVFFYSGFDDSAS